MMVASTRSPLLLAVLRPLYALGIFATVLSFVARGLTPALHGWRVGMSRFIDGADLVTEVLAQLLMIVSLVTAAALLFQLTRTRVHLAIKIVTVLLGLVVLTLCVTSIGFPRTPIILHVIIALPAIAIAILCGADTAFRSRLGGLAILAACVASLVRGIGSYVAEAAAEERKNVEAMRAAFDFAQVAATIAMVFVMVSIVAASVWLVRAERRKGPIAIGVALALALAIGLQARGLPAADEGSLAVLLRRIGQHLVTRPYSLGSPFFAAFVASLSALLAIGVATLVSRRHRAMGPTIALVLVVGASAEVPLLSVALLVGSIGMCIDRRDQEGVFAALEAAADPSSTGQSHAESAPSAEGAHAAGPANGQAAAWPNSDGKLVPEHRLD